MSTTKIRLSITLPGSVLFSQEETCKLQDVAKVDHSKFEHFQMQVLDRGKPETIKVSMRKCRPATQVISLSEEAYDEFVNPNIVPYKYKGVWKAITNNQRVLWHCEQIANALGGKLESFVILD